MNDDDYHMKAFSRDIGLVWLLGVFCFKVFAVCGPEGGPRLTLECVGFYLMLVALFTCGLVAIQKRRDRINNESAEGD